MNWSFGPPDRQIQTVPFEMLFTRGEFPPRDAFAELIRRMRHTVFYMACDSGATRREAVTKAAEVFLEFAPEFPGAPPQLGLRRLARVIKRAIGPQAFEPFYFYAQALAYYMREPLQRDVLRRFYETGALLSEARIAEEFGLANAAEAAKILRESQASFLEVLKELPEEELKLMTDGQFPL
jgi:hypothetical protein